MALAGTVFTLKDIAVIFGEIIVMKIVTEWICVFLLLTSSQGYMYMLIDTSNSTERDIISTQDAFETFSQDDSS